jgi:hypothetical protein
VDARVLDARGSEQKFHNASPLKIGRRLTLMNADQNLVNLRNLLIFIHGVELALMKSPSKII